MDFPQVIFFPVFSKKKFYVPCRLPVGPRYIAPCALSSNVFLAFLSLCTCAYASKWILQLFFQSSYLPVMIVCGLYVVYIPIVGGKELRNITTCLANSIFIRLVKVGKGGLALCDYIRYLVSCIYLSTSGTLSHTPVVLRDLLTTLSSRN